MKIVSQDPLLHFAVYAHQLSGDATVIVPEAEKNALIDYFLVLYAESPASVFDATELAEPTERPIGEPLKVESGLSLQTILAFLERNHYERTAYCRQKYQWSQRGFVLDIYSDNLYRFELGPEDTVESIRLVDPETQMSRGRLVEAVLWPKFETVLPLNTIGRAVLYDVARVSRELESKGAQLSCAVEEYRVEAAESFLEPTHISLKDLAVRGQKTILVTEFPEVFARRLGWPIVESIHQGVVNGIPKFVVQGRVRAPFRINDYDVFVDKESISWSSSSSRSPVLVWNELRKGDPVLHTDRGIGIYNGLTDLGGKTYFEVLYRDGRVLVPLERSQKLFRVPKTLSIDALDPARWRQRKKALSERSLRIRTFLEQRFRARKQLTAPIITSDPEIESAFAHSFPYQETADQLAALRDLSRWLELPNPEEALIIGESGVGKTEVIMRLAVKVASAGFKAVIVVPTRVLVDQYMAAYAERVSAAGLFLGDDPRTDYDILVGTHRVLKEGTYDDRLALVIYDEEQKFGVSHKTWFQERYPWIRVIYSSATPIPRTFFLARKGYISLVRMHELPYGRQRVKVFADQYDEALVKRLVAAELGRGGLVLYVHPTVRGIDHRAMELQNSFPDARVEVLHAQMTDKDITDTFKMVQKGEIQILVATTILEAGVDIPIANTLIVEDATHLGVSQMYQLKGRVGRGGSRAYAWFLYPKGTAPSTVKRLHDTVRLLNVSDTLALAELDVHYRGIGEIFGLRQHGVLKNEEVFAVDALLEESYKEEETVIENFPYTMEVPEWFMPEPERGTFIKSVLDAENEKELLSLFLFARDSSGRVPSEVKALFAYALLRILGSKKGMSVIKFTPKGAQLKSVNNELFEVHGQGWPQISALYAYLGGTEEWSEILRE
ncbi:DEAD/DEAH box helicase [Coprothermobacteraceae bacterium]|nr:DEAD/DEAH box helicase [Coprothermobacteraceae bacterium]